MRYILHYTEPWDVVFDGFCGTGMTGVAARECGNSAPDTKAQISADMPDIRWGERYSVQSELSPAATFIAQGYNLPILTKQFRVECKEILKMTETAHAWMYKTRHPGSDAYGEINYVIWSQLYPVRFLRMLNIEKRIKNCVHVIFCLTFEKVLGRRIFRNYLIFGGNHENAVHHRTLEKRKITVTP